MLTHITVVCTRCSRGGNRRDANTESRDWNSLVLGSQEVVGSNPIISTNFIPEGVLLDDAFVASLQVGIRVEHSVVLLEDRQLRSFDRLYSASD